MKLPQISQLFSARSISLAWKAPLVSFWIAIAFQNIIVRSTTPPISSSVLMLLIEPLNTTSHVLLARRFWLSGDKPEALRELALADRSPRGAVLGAQSEQVLASWENEPRAAQRELAFWQDIIEKHPDYPDGYLGAAVASIKEKQLELAQRYTDLLLSHDPNNAMGLQLATLLGASH